MHKEFQDRVVRALAVVVGAVTAACVTAVVDAHPRAGRPGCGSGGELDR